MKFTEEISDARYQITGYDTGWVGVNQEKLQQSFIITPQTLLKDWQPRTIQELQPVHLTPLLAMNLEVILLGCGKTQQFPAHETWRTLVQHGIGFEIMTNDAVCRTYNLLLTENRRIAAAFLLG